MEPKKAYLEATKEVIRVSPEFGVANYYCKTNGMYNEISYDEACKLFDTHIKKELLYRNFGTTKHGVIKGSIIVWELTPIAS